MTHPETPDPLGFLIRDPAGDPRTEDAATERTVTSSPGGPGSGGVFPTRRELRLQREAREREAQRVAEGDSALETIPGVPAAPMAVAADNGYEPAALVAPPTLPGRGGAPIAAPHRRIPSAERSARRRTIRQRITATTTMVLVGGVFASLTLPAYAIPTGRNRAALAADTSTQTLSVSAANVAAAARDGYGATSFTDLRARYIASTRQQTAATYDHAAAVALGDDFPWWDQLTAEQGGGLSPLRYNYRECVDFVAWRLNVDAGTTTAPYKWTWATLTPGRGNARDWPAAWKANGWATGGAPQVGGVAAFPAQNHVAYVSAVYADGSVLLEEYNWNTDHRYGKRVVPASSVPLFLAPPPR